MYLSITRLYNYKSKTNKLINFIISINIYIKYSYLIVLCKNSILTLPTTYLGSDIIITGVSYYCFELAATVFANNTYIATYFNNKEKMPFSER